MIIPTTRNAFDRVASGFSYDGHNLYTPCTCADKGTGCAQGIPSDRCPAGLGGKCASGSDLNVRADGGGGQPCLWWSQGCSIGCEYCLTDPNHPDNNGTIPTTPINGNPPHADKAGFRKSYCENPTVKAVLPREYWTLNMHAVPGAVNDSYQFNPWRAPGSAPVVDPCGQAGGKFKQTPVGGDSVYTDTEQAQMGDMGSAVLQPVADELQAKWKAGAAAEVAWGMRYNHGGGYQYRLCPADEPLTEACFQKLPLEFVKSEHKLLWNNGSLIAVLGE